MKMEEIIQKVSEVYREERGKLCDLQDELRTLLTTLTEAEKTGYKDITFSQYIKLTSREAQLRIEIKEKAQYCEGIFCVRELLMDLGFDTKVE